jgi:hypothetical protein
MADTTTLPVLTSQARVRTEKARTYLSQLCKHFAHKTKTDLTPTHGRVQFEQRIFEADASEPGVLVLSCEGPDPRSLAAMEDIVDRHLRRFAYKEELSIQWVQSAG